jgi:hypothetical protein
MSNYMYGKIKACKTFLALSTVVILITQLAFNLPLPIIFLKLCISLLNLCQRNPQHQTNDQHPTETPPKQIVHLALAQ